MLNYDIVSEAIEQTRRLKVYALHTMPRRPSQGRVLFLGGSSFDLRLKRQFLSSALVEHFEVVTFEPRGLGRTQPPEGPLTMADYAHDAAAYMEALGWEQASVLGESFGGMTALHLALLHPSKVARMALVSTTAGGEGGSSYDISAFFDLSVEEAARRFLLLQDTANEELRQNDAAAFEARVTERAKFEKRFREAAADTAYVRLLDARREHDVWRQLPKIACEVRVVAGARDLQAPVEAQQRMAGALPNAVFTQYPAGHGVAFAHQSVMEELCASWRSPDA